MYSNHKDEIQAGFFVRLAAYCIDMLIVASVLSIIKMPFLIAAIINSQNIFARDFIFDYSMQDILFYCLQVSYFIILTYTTGSSLGKKALRLKVVSDKDEGLRLIDVIYRETIGRFLSALVCFVGYVMVGLRADKKGLHDILSDTRVVYTFGRDASIEEKTSEIENPSVDESYECSQSRNEEGLTVESEH